MAQGEVLAFEDYVRTRQEALLRSARRLVPDPVDAQDLLQTALVRTYGRWDGIADKSLADAYLRRVMINTRTEWWRARKLEEVPTEQPCAGKAYPVDTSYGSLTGGPSADVVVNVMSCADSVSVGTYVYRADDDGAYKNVFSAEVPAVYGTIDRGDLVVTTQVYGSKDPLSSPSGSEVVTYRWASDRFTEHDRVHNDFSRAVEGADGDLPVQSEPVDPVEPEPVPSDGPVKPDRN
ncbi:SigE family RNA polymerase sigma factor [Streptomyces griseus]